MSDLLRKYKSLYSSTANTFSTGESVTITPASVVGLPTDTEITLTFDRVDGSGTKTPSKMERIRGTVVGSNFVVSAGGRAVEGTEQTHTSPVVEMVWNADDWNDTVDWGLVEHGQDGKHTSALVTSLKATGAVVNTGTSDVTIVTPKAIADSWLNNGYNSMARQAIINGNFDVWQRGTSFTSLAGVYTADRWFCYSPTSTISGTMSQVAAGLNGSQYAFKYQRTASETEAGASFVTYGLETKDAIKFRGVKLTLSFWAKCGANYSASSNALLTIIISGTGTDERLASGYTGSATIGSGTQTLTTSWQKFTVTTSAVVANTVTEFGIQFSSTSTGTAGADDSYYITQVQLCAGDVALPFMPKSFEEELRACQRYFIRYGGSSNYEGCAMLTGITTSILQGTLALPVQMRRPVLAADISITGTWQSSSGVDFTSIGGDNDRASNKAVFLSCAQAGTTFTEGYSYFMRTKNSTSVYLDISTEL